MSRELLDLRKVADRVSFSRSWVRRAIAAGAFPPPTHKFGRNVRWDAVVIDQWIDTVARERRVSA